jgi:hypothetical protein
MALSSYESSCAELSRTQAGQLRKMLNDAKRGKRHLVVVETGSTKSDRCQTHYLDEATYSSLPASAEPLCTSQSKTDDDRYCRLYSIDGKVSKQFVSWPKP